MRTPTLQYLYLQKPVTLIILICVLSVIPWIGLGDFATKGEPREAAVAVSMLETGNWVLPQVYADEFAYKPPMAHWLMAVFSYPQGYVSEFTSRLPSALAFIVLIGFTLFFFGKRLRFQEVFIATLLLITSIEIHRAAMTSRVDMLLTAFMVIGLFQLYQWEDQLEMKGLPVVIPLLLGCAVLTKGPVGVILPLFVFGVYLLILRKYTLLTVFKSLLYAGISSLFLPLIWYVAAWKQGGDDFLQVVLAENFGRFFHLSTPAISYELGHENGVWYNFMTLAAGFAPWTLFFFFSLFGIKRLKPGKSGKELFKEAVQSLRKMEKEKLFSAVALFCILLFYSIPSSKRSVYLMPAYPFIAIFLAQYTLYISETFMHPGVLTCCIIALLSIALITACIQIGKKINIKILYATITLVFVLLLATDGIVMRSIRKGSSARSFAEQITKDYPIDKTNMYVMNDLKKYTNLYGLNFYLGNRFHNFETQRPSEGFFFCTKKDFEKVQQAYIHTYEFVPLSVSDRVIADVRQQVVFSKFKQTGSL